MLDQLPANLPAPTNRPKHRRGAKHADGLQRQRLYARLVERPLAGIDRHEVDAHFEAMPSRYWERVTKSELIWGLETVHDFYRKLELAENSATVVVADSRHYPERGFTKVMVCSWDRPRLLAKIAAAFTALRVDIRRADVYTREDGLALDLFEVSDLNHGHLAEADRLKHLVFLLEGALSEPPRFVSIWANEFPRALPRSVDRTLRIGFDNDSSREQTIIRVNTADRLGLLQDLLLALSECELNITEALVETQDQFAVDVFYVTDLKARQILSSQLLEKIRKALIRAVSV